ncbi:MAG: tRNA methyl transferase PRC-barrel domain-containing protein, partial [Pseudonocardiales bacterium]
IADGDTRGFLAKQLGIHDGPIVDEASGEVVGSHAGSFGYTVGQRRGLKLDRPSPGGEPRYVLSIQPKTNTLVVGPGELLDADEVTAIRPLWTSGDAPTDDFDCLVQLRAHGMVTPATVRVNADGVVARLHGSQRGVAPGQALVMYDGDVVLGSATIAVARRTGVRA